MSNASRLHDRGGAFRLHGRPGSRIRQSSGIAGQVLDTSKAAVPGATVTVTNVATNAQRVTQSDSEGRFTIPNLPPATYWMNRASQDSRPRNSKTDAAQRRHRPSGSDACGSRRVGDRQRAVPESPLLQRTNASVSQTITQTQIENFVAGRNPLALATLSAGVTPQAFNRGTQFGAAGSSRSLYVTVEGGRDSSPATPSTVCTFARCGSTTCR